jgi:diguanylate cyclase (GGDEF)-like protein
MNTFRFRSEGTTEHNSHGAGWLIGLTGAVVLGFAVICVSILLDMKRADGELSRQASENLVATIEADISRNLELYDLSLQAVVEGMKLPEINQLSKHLRQLILFDRSATAKHLGAIQVTDEEGKVTIDSATLDPLPENNAQEEYFAVHKRDPNVGLFISRPVMRANEESIVVLSRRLSRADGSFSGVVAGTIRLSYFRNLFERVHVGLDETLTLLRGDGTILMRNPYDPASIGRNINQSALAKQMLVRDQDHAEAVASIDGIERLYVWRAGRQYPFVVSSGRSLNSIYARWHTEVTRIGTSMFALMVLSTGLAIWLGTELKRRATAEAKLTAMAMTDSLTGLSNRRRFDEILAVEWQRAIRQSTPIALLMIDADHFKLFNDKFGHQTGDAVLTKVASCIHTSIRNSAGDHAARYGGEEFAVLLPGASESEAFVVGERIRNKVQDTSRTGGTVTVSIGVASMLPTANKTPSELVALADDTLYQAKSRGRNQTCPVPQQAAWLHKNTRSAKIIKLVG